VNSIEAFWEQFDSPEVLSAAQEVLQRWLAAGYRRRLGPNHVVLEAAGPAASGVRTVIALYNDGRVLVPFGAYAGQNSGIPIPTLVTDEFRRAADSLFGFTGTETQARTAPGWLQGGRVESLVQFCLQVAAAYAMVLNTSPTP
jgi:hypothetical protein